MIDYYFAYENKKYRKRNQSLNDLVSLVKELGIYEDDKIKTCIHDYKVTKGCTWKKIYDLQCELKWQYCSGADTSNAHKLITALDLWNELVEDTDLMLFHDYYSGPI